IQETISKNQEQISVKRDQLEKAKKLKNESQFLTEKQYGFQEENLRLSAAREQALERMETAGKTLQNAEKELLDLHEQYTNIAAEAASFMTRFDLTFSLENGSVLLHELRQRAHRFSAQTEALQQTRLHAAEAEGTLQKFLATQQEKEK